MVDYHSSNVSYKNEHLTMKTQTHKCRLCSDSVANLVILSLDFTTLKNL